MSTAKESTSVSPSKSWLLILKEEYTTALTATVKSSAAWFFLVIMLGAVAILVLKDRMDVLHAAIPFLLGVPLLIAITLPLTSGVHQIQPIETRCAKWQLWLQVGILLIIIVFMAYRTVTFYFPQTFYIPGVYEFARWSIYFLGPKTAVVPGQMYSAPKPPGHLVAIPVLEFLIPCPLLLFLGASLREIGLGRGYFSWRVILLWCLFPVLGIIAVTVLGIDTGLIMFMQHLGREVLQSGFFTEFLFRGALMTRLTYLFRADWAIVITMIIFGLSFVGFQTNEVYGDWLVGAASTMLNQAMVGLGLAVILQRTGNLLASSVFYTLFETFIAFT